MAASRTATGSNKRRIRRHGCELPWASAQVIAIAIILLSVAVFYAFSVHELPPEVQRIVLVLVSVQLATVIIVFVSISLLDPAHTAVIERNKRHGSSHSMTNATQSPDDSLPDLERQDSNSITTASTSKPQLSKSCSSSSSSTSSRSRLRCALCDVAVSIGTRHCSVCRKCVVGFDHHCVYLNTCIGSRNYPLFIALLTCTILLVSSQSAVAIYAIDRLRRRGDTTRAIIVGTLSVLPLLQLFSMLVLAVFHSYLFCKGLKTYEWLRRFHDRNSRFAAKTPTWNRRRNTPDYSDDGESEREDDPKTRAAGTATATTKPSTDLRRLDSV